MYSRSSALATHGLYPARSGLHLNVTPCWSEEKVKVESVLSVWTRCSETSRFSGPAPGSIGVYPGTPQGATPAQAVMIHLLAEALTCFIA